MRSSTILVKFKVSALVVNADNPAIRRNKLMLEPRLFKVLLSEVMGSSLTVKPSIPGY